jgi:hypothetical protein
MAIAQFWMCLYHLHISDFDSKIICFVTGVAQALVFCDVFCIVLFILFLLAIAMSVLFRFTASYSSYFPLMCPKWFPFMQSSMEILYIFPVICNFNVTLLNAKFLYQFQIQDFNLIKWHLVYSLFISKKCLFIGEPRNHGEVYSIQHYVIKFVSDL